MSKVGLWLALPYCSDHLMSVSEPVASSDRRPPSLHVQGKSRAGHPTQNRPAKCPALHVSASQVSLRLAIPYSLYRLSEIYAVDIIPVVFLCIIHPPLKMGKANTTESMVADPDPDWIRIQSGQWIQIQEGKNDPQK